MSSLSDIPSEVKRGNSTTEREVAELNTVEPVKTCRFHSSLNTMGLRSSASLNAIVTPLIAAQPFQGTPKRKQAHDVHDSSTKRLCRSANYRRSVPRTVPNGGFDFDCEEVRDWANTVQALADFEISTNDSAPSHRQWSQVEPGRRRKTTSLAYLFGKEEGDTTSSSSSEDDDDDEDQSVSSSTSQTTTSESANSLSTETSEEETNQICMPPPLTPAPFSYGYTSVSLAETSRQLRLHYYSVQHDASIYTQRPGTGVHVTVPFTETVYGERRGSRWSRCRL